MAAPLSRRFFDRRVIRVISAASMLVLAALALYSIFSDVHGSIRTGAAG